jgi:beta-galactosidase
MYFQWRRGRGGSEKFHGAVVEHAGRSDTRVFREVSELGAELERLGDTTIGATTPARVAVLFDWNNWWAIESAVGPINPKDYVGTVKQHYNALWRKNVPVDIVFSDSDLSRYDLVIAPMLYMVKPGVAEHVEALLRRGGTFVASVFSGVVDETDLAFEGYPGPLRNALGIWIEEIDALYPDQHNRIVMSDGGKYSCSELCEIVHCETAQPLATFGEDFYAGSPAVTENAFGQGKAYYIATQAEDRFLDEFYGKLLQAQGIESVLKTPDGVEATLREKDGRRLLFVLNHNAASTSITLPDGAQFHDHLSGQAASGALELPGYGVSLLEARA